MGRNRSFFSVFSINGQNALFFKAWKAMRTWIIDNWATGNSNIQSELRKLKIEVSTGQKIDRFMLFWVIFALKIAKKNTLENLKTLTWQTCLH